MNGYWFCSYFGDDYTGNHIDVVLLFIFGPNGIEIWTDNDLMWKRLKNSIPPNLVYVIRASPNACSGVKDPIFCKVLKMNRFWSTSNTIFYQKMVENLPSLCNITSAPQRYGLQREIQTTAKLTWFVLIR